MKKNINFDFAKILKYALLGIGGLLVFKMFTKNKTPQFGDGDPTNDDMGGSGAKTTSGMEQWQLTLLANKIDNAWGVFNDDENAIYNVFRSLSTFGDLKGLIRAYGTRHKEDLMTAIQKRLNKKEIEKINNILLNKGIKYNF